MSTPKAVVEIQAARTKQPAKPKNSTWGYTLRRQGWDPMPVPADRPVRLLSVEEIRAYEAEIRARPPKANRSLPR